MTGPNPAWDPDLRWRVQHAFDTVCRTAADVVRRHAPDGGYTPPSEVAECGDLNGLIASGQLEVLGRIAAAVDTARQVIAAAQSQMDSYQRERYGEAWQPDGSASPLGPDVRER